VHGKTQWLIALKTNAIICCAKANPNPNPNPNPNSNPNPNLLSQGYCNMQGTKDCSCLVKERIPWCVEGSQS